MKMKVWFFSSILALLFFLPSAHAHHDMVEAHLNYGKLTSTSHILNVDTPTTLQLELNNTADSAGNLCYKVYQITEFVDDENNNQITQYNKTVLLGSVPFFIDKNGNFPGKHEVRTFHVQPGRYFIELSTLLECFPVIDTPSCEGHAVLKQATK